ncbi:hypothetical protein C8046_15505 [Serinibacter arcticus]|uniref:Uncharacterized protein n=1 Tax=Serinibacter arcticus TaxID=1655435 RepID=A0A2U1ZXZ3_9MICO|nr:hypothetical protein [Serinibacter arcticus]PWD51841.1 hypothetical protein C8046_15505 [Serinibacter arcticus]
MTTPPPGYGQQPHDSVPQHGAGTPAPAGYGQQVPAGYGQPVPAGYGQQAPAQYGQPAPVGQGGHAQIDLTVQGSFMTRSFIAPTVWVNGHVLKSEYGSRLVPVPAGPVRVDVQCSWMRTYGQASLSFTAGPGQTVPVFYASPMHQFTTGNIGHTKQTHKGMALMWSIFGFVIAMGLLSIVLAVVSG